MRSAHGILGLSLLAAGLLAAPVACVDVVHQQEVDALGPEQPGVPPGPTHRPGQPCLACHGGSGPAKLQFSVGGTVYDVQGQTQPAVNAAVQIEDVDGKTWTVFTNEVGNFFVTLRDFQPHYPTTNTVTSADGKNSQAMGTLDNRDGSCADCHTSTPGPNSAGPVWIARAAADGGAP